MMEMLLLIAAATNAVQLLPPEYETATRALPMTRAVLTKMLAILKCAYWLSSMAAAPAAAS